MKRYVCCQLNDRTTCQTTPCNCNTCCSAMIMPSCFNPCCYETGINFHNGCNNIIASISLIEAAIAHILNSEGEKIQRMLEISNCPDDLLVLNKSVTDVIIQVTQLEQVLCEKLILARELPEKKYLPLCS